MGERFRVPPPPVLPVPAAYALALAVPVVTLVIQTLLRRWLEAEPSVLFLVAVALVAWAGGFWPGFVATLGAAGLGGWFLASSASPERAGEAALMAAVFVPAGAIIAMMGALARAAVLERAAAAEIVAASVARERAHAAELEALVEAVPAFVWIARDHTARDVWSNRAAAELLKLPAGTRASEEPGAAAAPYRILVDGAEVGPDELPLHRAARGEAVRGVELELAFDDGTRRRILGNAAPIRSDDGVPRGAVGAFIDVSILAEALRALREREHELGEAVQARDAFLSAASHELKTPLTALSLVVQTLLRRRASGADPTPQLEAIGRQVQRLSRLIDDLLDVSRISAGRLRLDLTELDLAQVVAEVTARLESERQPGGAPLELDLRGPVRGRWDRLRLEQIAVNLLTNALKYGEGSPVTVTVSQDGEEAVLCVRDGGIGVPPAEQGRIFERFERGSAARNYGGIGLGLWIVREIVGALGGTISVESGAGAGATFTVRLPAEPTAAATRCSA
jgi:signal transduction histidine kinase